VLMQTQGVQSPLVPADRLDNGSTSPIQLAGGQGAPAVARIYQLDSLVRRSTSLQLTADARAAALDAEGVAA
jgi:NADH-quinone oxidoreductase subunit G